MPIVKGSGIYLFSEKGDPYLDAISSWWVNLHGHAHPYIIEQLKEQLDLLEHVLFAGFTHPSAIHLGEKLIGLLPGPMSKVFYSDNGSTAVEVALKIALQYWQNLGIDNRKSIICFKGSYHGDTFGAMSCSGKNCFNRPFWNYLFSVKAIDPPTEKNQDQVLSTFSELLKEKDVACFIFEPLVLGSGGMIFYSKSTLNEMIKMCRESHVITIADEVMTGFGRTGTLFACDQIDETPDLICLSKGLTGGFLPLGATACKSPIFEAFRRESLSESFLHGHSYTANPIACRSALASLQLLLSSESKNKREAIEKAHGVFCKEIGENPVLSRCESLGTILALTFKTSSQTSYENPLRTWLYRFFLERKIIIRPLGNVLYIMPPYCITTSELEKIYQTILEAIENIP